MKCGLALVVAACVLGAWLPETTWAREGQHQQVPTDARVDFGVLVVAPPAPLGPLPCLQSGAIGGPQDPCSYLLHHLTPEEVTIRKGGQVTFQFHGGGHGFALYQVSPDTTREELGQFLCAGAIRPRWSWQTSVCSSATSARPMPTPSTWLPMDAATSSWLPRRT